MPATQLDARSRLRFPAFTTCRTLLNHAVFLLGTMLLCQSCAAQRARIEAQRAALEADRQAAIQDVQRIVNQPVRQFRLTDDMRVSTCSPGWFHAGAGRPDFNNVDIRATQDTSYGKYEYVTSDLNPGVVFPGSEVEFNSMTKYFYIDRTLPKKRLSNDEMTEINRLYRIIGGCEKQLAELQK